MGQPGRAHTLSLTFESIGSKGERGEVKHLSTLRKRNQRDSVSSGERTRSSPNLQACLKGLWGPDMGLMMDSGTVWKGRP